MASVEVAKLQKHEVQELGAVYAALLLSDAGVALDEKKLESVAKSAGVTVDATYAKFFVRALKGKKVETFFAVGGGAGGAAPAKGGDGTLTLHQSILISLSFLFFQKYSLFCCRPLLI